MNKSVFFRKWLLLWVVSFTLGIRITGLFSSAFSEILIELWEPTSFVRNDLFYSLLRYQIVFDIFGGILFLTCTTVITLAIDQIRSKGTSAV